MTAGQPVAKRGSTTPKKASPVKKKTVTDGKMLPKIAKKKIWKPRRKKQEYGTSKLEEYFAHEFLDKLGVEYQYQFKAEDIGRYYDFRVLPDGPILEVDGGYYHSDPRLYEEKDLNAMQKHNKKVDEYKDKWALAHGIPIYRFWEKDIKENPSYVMEKLREILYISDTKKKIKENKKKRH